MRKAYDFGIQKLNLLVERLERETNATNVTYLTEGDMAVINEYLQVMSPIAISLDRLQREKSASQGFLMPTLMSMKFRISSLQGGNLLKAFKKTALEVINKRFERYFIINDRSRALVLAAVSLPHFKTSFLESPIDQRTASKILTDECIRTINDREIKTITPENFPETTDDDDFFYFVCLC